MKDDRSRSICLLQTINRNMRRCVEKRVAGTGVFRSQHKLLMTLGKHQDCSQTELAEKLEISPTAVAVSLKKLEKTGYISRQCDSRDNRVNQIVITEKGQDMIRRSVEYFREIDDNMLKGFSEQEIQELNGLLTRMQQNGEAYYQSLNSSEVLKEETEEMEE